MNKKKAFLIGITGTFGAGKSTVGEILVKNGVFVIDADHIVSQVLQTPNKISNKVVKTFGKEIINKRFRGFYINKSKLAKIVFSSTIKKRLLENVIHPEVQKRLRLIIKSKKQKKQIIAILAPLLFEANMEKMFDDIWCVVCSNKVRVSRLNRKGYNSLEIKQRTKSQLPQNIKASKVDFIIDNSSLFTRTRKQVLRRLQFLRSRL